MAKLTFDLKIGSVENTKLRFFSKDVKLYFGQEAARLMDPYVPYDQGQLAENYIVTEEYIEYQQPYAHRQYNGTNFNFSRDQHPLATAKWDEAMMKAKKEQLVKAVQDYISLRK